MSYNPLKKACFNLLNISHLCKLMLPHSSSGTSLTMELTSVGRKYQLFLFSLLKTTDSPHSCMFILSTPVPCNLAVEACWRAFLPALDSVAELMGTK